MRAILFFLLALVVSPVSAQVRPEISSSEARATISSALGSILQADGISAREVLLGIRSEELSADDFRWRACTLSRLDGRKGADANLDSGGDLGPSGAGILHAYRRFWTRSVMQPGKREAFEKQLLENLSVRLGLQAEDGVLAATADYFEERGGGAISGRTGPLLDLIAWREKRSETEISVLPEGLGSAVVHYLDDFASLGWSAYLTCGRSGTGGWTATDGLYVIVPMYDSLEDEAFRISYLVHETQHFADNRNFPQLAGWELEYRAKLAELSYLVADRNRVLRRFAANRGEDPADAHSYANSQVLGALAQELEMEVGAQMLEVEVGAMQFAAATLLREHTARRKADDSQ